MQNFMKTILNAVQKWTTDKIKNSTADWNQNNPNALNYVKNRPFSSDFTETRILNETIKHQEMYSSFSSPIYFTEGVEYKIIFNDIEYNCMAYNVFEDYVYIGNAQIANGQDDWKIEGFPESNEPFFIYYDKYYDESYFMASQPGSYSITIYEIKSIIHKIDPKYLPDEAKCFSYKIGKLVFEADCSDNPRYDIEADSYSSNTDFAYVELNGVSYIAYTNGREINGGNSKEDESIPFRLADFGSDGYWFLADEDISYVKIYECSVVSVPKWALPEKYANVEEIKRLDINIDKKMNTNDPTARGIFNLLPLNGKCCVRFGNYIHNVDVEGGLFSAAIGEGTIALGDNSVATGRFNKKDAEYVLSTTQATTTWKTNRYIYYSTEINIENGVVELVNQQYEYLSNLTNQGQPFYFTTSSYVSNSRSVYYTPDGVHNGTNFKDLYLCNVSRKDGDVSKYAHIVGNGISDNGIERSNAHTLDWEGNAWFSGDVYVGSTSGRNKDEGSKKLMTTDDLGNYYTKLEVEQFHDEIKDYVDDEVAALVNAAPETLDTLGELATAFAENKEVVDALDASITNKQDKISDALILVDTVTGKQHKIQIQNGQLVSFEV